VGFFGIAVEIQIWVLAGPVPEKAKFFADLVMAETAQLGKEVSELFSLQETPFLNSSGTENYLSYGMDKLQVIYITDI